MDEATGRPIPIVLGTKDSQNIETSVSLKRSCPACFKLFELDAGEFATIRDDVSLLMCKSCVATPNIGVVVRERWKELGEDLDKIIDHRLEEDY